MTDDLLSAVWNSDPPTARRSLDAVMLAVLEHDRATRRKELRIRLVSALAAALLFPVLVWCAAYGATPVVRAAYALMGAGTAVLVFAEWMYLAWSRDARPGAADTQSQLHKVAVVVSRQAMLMKTAALWCAPIFMGGALIAWWLYEERSRSAGVLLWAVVGAAWVGTAIGCAYHGSRLDERRLHMEGLLNELR